MTDNRAFGIDVSHYDGLLNWKAVLEHVPEVTFIGYRATISWGYRDPFFLANWKDGEIHAIPRLAYHVVYPGEDVLRQVDNLFAALDKVLLPTDKIVLDVELDHGISKTNITNSVLKHADLCKKRTGEYPILYSRAIWLNQFTFPMEFTHLKLWTAQYLNKRPLAKYANEMIPSQDHPILLPTGFNNYLIHQTGHETPPFCSTTTKSYQDYDRWNGTKADVRAFFGVANVPDVPDVDPLDEIEQSAKDILTHVAEMRG